MVGWGKRKKRKERKKKRTNSSKLASERADGDAGGEQQAWHPRVHEEKVWVRVAVVGNYIINSLINKKRKEACF